MTVTALQRQTLFDVALLHFGSIEAVYELAASNDIGLTDEIEGDTLTAVEVFDKKTVEYYANNAIVPATETETDDIDLIIVVTPRRLTLAQAGETKSFTVTCNDIWKVDETMIPLMGLTWLSLEKSGQTIQCTAPEHTGRVIRGGMVIVLTSGNCGNYCTVQQTPKAEFIEFTNASVNVDASANTFTVHAKSNTSTVTAELSNNSVGAVITRITAAGKTITSGQSIAGDPGATAEYDIIVTGSCSVNTAHAAKACTLTLTDNAGNSDSVVINQAAGDSSISLSSDSLAFAQAGETKSITVTSNDTWTVDAVEA
jgi:hypothetical protein